MKLDLHHEPRVFTPAPGVELADLGTVDLNPDEQLTFRSPSGSCFDVLQKDWGFYLGNSVNGTMTLNGFRTALVLSLLGGRRRLFLNLVEHGNEPRFLEYLAANDSILFAWLDEWLPDSEND